MRLTKTTFTFLSMCAVFSAQAQDDGVMVDLSVLNSLDGAYVAPDEPLFPVLPPQTKAKPAVDAPTVKRKAVKKAAIKAEPLPKIPETARQSDTAVEDIVVVDVEPSALPVETKAEPAADETVKAAAAVWNNPKVTAPDAAKADEVMISQPKADDGESQSNEEIIPSAEVVIQQATPVVSEPQKSDDATPPALQVAATNPQEAETAETVEATQPIEESATEVSPALQEQALLVLASGSSVDLRPNGILFADDADELNAEQQARIDAIVGAFKNEKTNKIAIYSYNLDDGADSFRKKRTSLNRAIEVRSYLLKKGFKNFSIKVVNVGGDSKKINMVELEEI